MAKIRPQADGELFQQLKQLYPEVKGLTASGLVDWALRKLIQIELKKRKEWRLPEMKLDRGQVDD